MENSHRSLIRFTGIWMIMLLFITAAITLSGCSDKEKVKDTDYDYGSREVDDPKMMGSKAYGYVTVNPAQHDNKFMKYDDKLSKKVSSIPGVASATVITTDKNAYVAFLLNLSASGTRSKPAPTEQINSEGYQQQFITKQDKINDPNQIAKYYNSNYSVPDHRDISPELKQTIALAIRDEASGIKEVHISANMDFVNQLFNYAKYARAQKELDEQLPAFNRLVRHHFMP